MRRLRPRPRRGTLLFCVMAVMAVVVSLMGLVVRDAVRARREAKMRLQLHQTDRLLDAGVLRAVKQLKADPNYGGETWQPSFQFSGQDTHVRVAISVNDTQIQVTAKLGNEPHVTTRSHVFEVR